MLTDKEKLIIKILEEDPLIKQEELAERTGSSRTAVAAHISNLQKKGFILGRGYYLKYPTEISIIGGINLSFTGSSNEKYISNKNNVGTMKIDVNGTAYNIYKNLLELEESVNVISFIGDDSYGEHIIKILKNYKLDIIELIKVSGLQTGLYTSLRESDGTFIGAVLSMELFTKLQLNDFKSIIPKIKNSRLVYIDTNYPLAIVNEIGNLSTETYFIYNTITPLLVCELKKIKFNIGFIATSMDELNRMFKTDLVRPEEGINLLKEKGIEEGFIYGTDKIFFFSKTGSFMVESNREREYYISKVIMLKNKEKNITAKYFM